MPQALAHVVGWINAQPTEVVWKQENTKSLLRNDMVPILQAYAPVTALGTNSDNDLGDGNGTTRSTPPCCQAASEGDENSGAAAWAEELSIVLERRVLDFVRDNMATFKDPSNQFYLWSMLDQYDERYKSRFTEDGLWRDLYNYIMSWDGPKKMLGRLLLMFTFLGRLGFKKYLNYWRHWKRR